MIKFVIKNADGSEQNVIPAVHNTRQSAINAISKYVNDSLSEMNNNFCFNFTIEKVKGKDVNERITNFKSARLALRRKPNTDFYVVKEKFSRNDVSLEDVARLVNDINPNHLEALIALNKLFTIAEAWNKEDGFVPDFSDWEQAKWFPWFKYDEDADGFVCANTANAPTTARAYIGSRLCFKSSERAMQFGIQFIDLYNKVFL